MSCDCTEAPRLSGSYFANVQKLASEAVPLVANWCADLEEDGQILFSAWASTPETESAPLLITDESTAEPLTSAKVSGGRACQLYRVTNTVDLKRTADGPTETLVFTFWVYINRP